MADHSKTGLFHFRTQIDHPDTGLVRYLDGHCTVKTNQKRVSHSVNRYKSPIGKEILFFSQDWLLEQLLSRANFQVSTFVCLHCAWNKRTRFKNIFEVVVFVCWKEKKSPKLQKSFPNHKNGPAQVALRTVCLITEIHLHTRQKNWDLFIEPFLKVNWKTSLRAVWNAESKVAQFLPKVVQNIKKCSRWKNWSNRSVHWWSKDVKFSG
jgi:hypothetical protein